MPRVTRKIVRWALLLFAVVLGLTVGTVGTFEHRASATLFGVAWPSGLLLAFCGLVGALLMLGELGTAGVTGSWRPTRLSALGCATAGWLVAVLWLTYFGPPLSGDRKGDVVLANDWRSMLYLVGGMLVATAAVYRAWVGALAARLEKFSAAQKPPAVRSKG
jgi:hypothetical protein